MKPILKKSIATVMSVVLTVSLVPLQAMADSSIDEGEGAEVQASQSDSQTSEVQANQEKAAVSVVNNDLASQKELLLQLNPVVVNDTVDKFISSLSKFAADTSKLSDLSAALTRFSGVTAGVGGVISVLKLAGVIKDPTWELLKTIQAAVQNVETKLSQMDAKLDNIQKDLSRVAVAQQEIKRSNDADKMLNYWNTFNTNYCEPLEDKLVEYKGLISAGIMDWWQSGSRESLRIVYTLKDGKNLLTYTSAPYSQGFSVKADNEETINKNASFGIPAAVLPDMSGVGFNMDNYQDLFVEAMSKSFITAINNGDLDANKQFYSSWKKLSDTEKKAKAKEYARDILDTIVYKISRNTMTKNNAWVISVLNAYRNYCNNVLAKNSGVDALLNTIYLTHNFEGEVKDEIQNFGDSMIVRAGYYGQFAMTCASQSRLQSLESRQEMQNLFVETVDKLADKKAKSVTGHDNYSYIASCVLNYKTVKLSSSFSAYRSGSDLKRLVKTKSNPWKITSVPMMVDGISLQMMYHQFQVNSQGCKTFQSYLNKYGILPSTILDGKFMTRYAGQQTFALTDGLSMNCISVLGDWCSTGKTYTINTNNGTEMDNRYFGVHDMIVYDVFNISNGAYDMNEPAVARALYAEGSVGWLVDEIHAFYYGMDAPKNTYKTYWCWNRSKTKKLTRGRWDYFNFSKTLQVLEPQSVFNMNADEGVNDNNPFFAFEGPSLTEYASSAFGLTKDVNKLPISDIELQSDSYTYEGSPVEPEVVVKSNGSVVPTDSYEVEYVDNDAVGTGTVCVTGKGDYAGSVTKRFSITEGDSPASGGKVNSSSSGSGSPKTSAGSSYSSSMPKTGDPFLLVLGGFFMMGLLGAGSLSLARRRR